MFAYAAVLADRVAGPILVGSAAALLALAAGLAWRVGALAQLALALGVGAYAVALLDASDFDRYAPLVGAGLLLAAELAYTAIEPPARRSWPFAAGSVAAAALLGALLLGAAGAGEGALAELALGVVAAAGALAVLAWLAAVSRR